MWELALSFGPLLQAGAMLRADETLPAACQGLLHLRQRSILERPKPVQPVWDGNQTAGVGFLRDRHREGQSSWLEAILREPAPRGASLCLGKPFLPLILKDKGFDAEVQPVSSMHGPQEGERQIPSQELDILKLLLCDIQRTELLDKLHQLLRGDSRHPGARLQVLPQRRFETRLQLSIVDHWRLPGLPRAKALPPRGAGAAVSPPAGPTPPHSRWRRRRGSAGSETR